MRIKKGGEIVRVYNMGITESMILQHLSENEDKCILLSENFVTKREYIVGGD